MIHEKLEGLMTPVEKIARVANAGLVAATTPQTSPSGAISLDNADGTRTIIGEVSNGEDNPSYTMATHVGDTTPPGIPTGITATSRSGVVVVEWDGTLTGGIPDDFFCVRIYLDGTELGALSEAGSVASAKLESGTTVSVTATSEDDCCLPDGTPAHNVSEATQAISVTVAKDASEVMADIDEQIEGVEQEIADFKSNTYTKAETDKKVQDLDDEISTELTTNYYNKNQIDTTYATKTLVSQTKEEIELSASQTYATKEDLSKTYATKAALTVGLDGVRSEVSETYSTKQQTADAIEAIQVGVRNLITLQNTYNGWLSESGGQGSAGSANNRRTGFIPVEAGEPYVAQTWVETFNNTSNGAAVYLVWYDADEAYISGIPQVGGSGSKYQVIKAIAPANAAYARVSWRAHRVGYAKLEQGTLPTDYTAAPEDLVARTNLTPFGSHDLTDVYDATSNPEGYWRQRPAADYVTQLADGWLHFERVNSGTGVVGSSMQIRPIPGVEPGDLLTVLIEVRNNQSTAMSTTGNFDDLYVQQGTNFQLWGTTVQSSTLVNNAQAKPLSALGESFEMRFTKVVDSDHKTGDYIVGFALNIRNGAGQTLSFDFRVSVYRGGYGGGYLPYSIEDTTLAKTYTRSSTFEQTMEGFRTEVSDTYATAEGLSKLSSQVEQTTTTWGVTLEALADDVGELQGETEEERNLIRAYMQFNRDSQDRPVLVLGSSDSDMQAQLTNEALSFLESGMAVAWISGQALHITTAEITSRLRFGDFAFIPRSNGNVALKWLGA